MASRSGERGAAAVELAVAASGLLLVLFFAVGALRVTTARGDVSAAARSAARAAAHTYGPAEAAQAAEVVVDDLLGERGTACRDRTVEVSDDYQPGAVVVVTVRCVVALDDVSLVGFGATEVVQATAAEPIDAVRGGG